MIRKVVIKASNGPVVRVRESYFHLADARRVMDRKAWLKLRPPT